MGARGCLAPFQVGAFCGFRVVAANGSSLVASWNASAPASGSSLHDTRTPFGVPNAEQRGARTGVSSRR
ncbi:hypothetical protein CHLRE_08g368026v5 [Chlamydomonas reinhardtii]|uniref:Uncharacterized protein n=1 Tax=Chlamydomonas reinhardtii TaxID=3055 RepID=A0A2K3D5Z0_CHLRE|nr:uncharacterized protein CHLRE_12g553552v5 [Chlamydomonas reinhardtii]XP_042919693.1 uncharacterized protein CHLRE_11g478982v5 [Chlamydomonas reinhardtii]XP_042921972.1 uncharacterized protein CHLRE_08g368026v5 [Chlamydomonas reinhardtii]PNW75952.1 hypothetical protein CHLRE_12g553552v5 [Chlamydomonas reinhardtii]PNW76853.1 hypothetical protein CHLRE_11g478982v5 [Chlamydomonas reinhardtii]PNW79820.1 hypothetical protein CHLRE_08g368026v5 [Chlamydomonas reinhardtii]